MKIYIMKILSLFSNLWIFRSIFSSIYFNFRLLPFNQAIKLPILLYKPKFGKLRHGSVIIDCKVEPGMIRIGHNVVNLYPNNGCMIDIKGSIVFKGRCLMGNNTRISVGEHGTLVFGEWFESTTEMKIACYNSIIFGNHVLVGWDCLFLDTDFHSLSSLDGKKNKGFAPIIVGDEVWFGAGCRIYKKSIIPSRCVISSNTNVYSDLSRFSYSVIGNKRELIPLSPGMFRNYQDDKIDYSIGKNNSV